MELKKNAKNMNYTIGIDIGGTNTDIGLVREDGKIVAKRNIPTNQYTEVDPYVRDIMSRIEELLGYEGGVEVDGIGIGAPNGNFYTNCIENAPNLTIKGRLDFGEAFGKYTKLPVVLSNDANAAAYGELIYGGARGGSGKKRLDNFIMFTLGTGVGSGIVLDGKLVHGSTGCAGELGHSILIPDGRPCSCGRKGCLETYTSARGIVQTYRELRAENPYPEQIGEGWIGPEVPDSEITCKMIGDAAHKGDPIALKTWEQTGWWLGIAMANAVTFSAPQALFLMGGPAQVGEPLLKPLRESFEEHLLNIFQGTCDIRVSELKANEVAILGAAALVKMKGVER